MKRKISLFLTAVFLFALLAPLNTFAAQDDELTKAITSVKDRFNISSSFTEFNYTINNIGSKKVWNFNWNRKDGIEEYISASIDNTGVILNYNHFKPETYPGTKLSKITREDAKSIAEAFLKKMNSNEYSQVRLAENVNNGLFDSVYYFKFVRLVNQVPYDNNFINIEVNRQTGDVQSYGFVWDNDLKFPPLDKVLSLEDAQSAYSKNMGLKLIYSSTYDDNKKLYTYPIYASIYGEGYCIDAVTGERIELNYGYPIPLYDSVINEKLISRKSAGGGFIETVLSPQEIKEIEKVSKLLKQDEAEKIARQTKYIGLTDEFKLTSAGLSKDWLNTEDYIWDFSFTKDPKDKDSRPLYDYVRINASTGDIRSFSINDNNYDPNAKGKFDIKAARAAVEKILKEFIPQKFAQTEYDQTYTDYRIFDGSILPPSSSFRFIRMVNGIPYPQNNIVVNFDAVNGKISSFDMVWHDLQFAAIDKVMPLDKITDKFFNEIGIELQYKPKYQKEYFTKPDYGMSNQKPEVKLVYVMKPGKPAYFDAFTGILLDANGKPFKDNKPAEYTDISGNIAEKQIIALAEYGISLDGPTFRPNEKITQKDFLVLVAKALGYYNQISSSSSDKEIDEMYNYLIRETVIKVDEKKPSASVSREDAVKFIIRALKFDKVADIKGIFKCDFKDMDKVNPDLVGYISIAKGLNLISGYKGYLNPKENVTRAESAIIIYNYLKR